MKVPEKFRDHIQISNSRREIMAGCPRKFYWTYVRKLQSKRPSIAMHYGSMWHLLLHKYYCHVRDYGWENNNTLGEGAIKNAMSHVLDEWQKAEEECGIVPDYRSIDNLAVSFTQYLQNYCHQDKANNMRVIDSEVEFAIEFLPTEEELSIYPELKEIKIVITGILDLLASVYGYNWVYEHKSTGAYIGSLTDKLHRSAQTIGYLWVAQTLFPDLQINGVVANIHHISARKNKSGEFGQTKIEFHREPLTYTQGDIREWRFSVIDTVLSNQRQQERGHYPMNFDRCYDFFSHCAYEPLCEQAKIDPAETFIDPERYKEREER